MSERIKRKKRWPSVVRWIAWVLLVQVILINIMAALYANRLTRFYTDPSLRTETSSGNVFSKTWRLFTGPRQARSEVIQRPVYGYDTIRLKTGNDIDIDAWYAEAEDSSKGTVIIFHGITMNKSMMLDEANEFRFLGYDVMLVDFRGHGSSGGNITTIGVKESEEVTVAYKYALSRKTGSVFLYGVSMGAVAVAKAVADNAMQPAGIILDMPFASLQSYLKNKARSLGFPQQPFAFLTTFWVGVERGFNGFGHATSSYMKDITCPVLYQWGAKDAFIKADETQAIFSSLKSAQKQLVIYNDAAHESFLGKDPVKWRSVVEKFLLKGSF